MLENKVEILNSTVKQIGNQKIMIAVPNDIGGWWGLVADDVMAMLKGQDITEIVLPISSFGGDVYEAFQIYNILKSHPAKVTAYLYSKCMSAATIVACSADTVYAVPQCIYMIHKAMSGTMGNADDQKKLAQILEINDNMIAGVLAKKSGMSKNDVLDLMSVESYFTSEQAAQLGFIDGIVDTIPFDFQLPDSIDFAATQNNDMSMLWNSVKGNIQNSDNYRIFNNADLSKYIKKEIQTNKQNTEGVETTQIIDNKKDNTEMKFENIWNVVKSFIAADKQEEARKAIETQGDEMLLSISNSVKLDIENSLTSRFDGLVKKEEAPVFNLASLKAILNSATAEEKAEILTDLGVVTETEKPIEVEETEVFKTLQTEVTNMKATLANVIGNTKKDTANNGGAAPIKTPDTKELSNEGEAQKEFYNKLFNRGGLTEDKYTELVAKLV